MEWLVVGAKIVGGIALLAAWAWLGWRLMASTEINGRTFSEEDMESSASFVAKAGDDFLKAPDTLWDLFKQHCPFFAFVLDNYWGPSAILVAMGHDSVELGRIVRDRCSPSLEWIEILRERNPEFIEAVFGPAPPEMTP